MEPDEVRRRTGLDVVGAFAFGDSAELADELLAVVAAGTKRATAGSRDHLQAEVDAGVSPFPAPGQRWGLLDGRGDLRFVMETVDVSQGPMRGVTPAFAWDEGEDDRTREAWLDAHRRYFARQGATDLDDLEVVFERFAIVWPEPDQVRWLAPHVREARFDERPLVAHLPVDRLARVAEGHDPATLAGLPMLVALAADRDPPVDDPAELLGVLVFRPRPDGDAEVVATLLGARGGADPAPVRGALLDAVLALARDHGWSRLRLPDGSLRRVV